MTVKFSTKDATVYDKDRKAMEKKLLGMAGVLYVHIHAHDGEETFQIFCE